MKLGGVAVAVLFTMGTLRGAGELTIEKVLQVRELTDIQISPDGQQVAVVVQEPSGNTLERHIWVYGVASKELRQWTRSAKSEQAPRWSPDGRWLAFLSNREDAMQIWVMPCNGGEATKLTSAKNSVATFRWSRDGKRIAFLAQDPRNDDEEKKQRDHDDAWVIDVDHKPMRVWTVEADSKAVKRVTSGPWHFSEVEWMPDGKRLIAIATDRPTEDRRTARLYSVELDDGRLEEIFAPKGPMGKIQVSPGGTAVAFVASPGTGPMSHDLFICPLDSRKPANVTGGTKDRPVLSYYWLNETEIAALLSSGFHRQLEVVGGRPRTLVAGDSADIASFAVSPAGAVAYVGGTATALPELFVEGKPVSHFHDMFAGVPLAQPELYRYSSFDGMPIEAALFRGAGSGPERPQPLVVLIHGGPAGEWRNHFDALTQLLAARGYAVMQPNIRGSTGYGQKFLESNRGDWGGGDFKDVMAGVDDLIRRKIADPNRLAIAGWSYGGYMAEWAITQTDRFKAAISGAGMADLATEYGTESGPESDEWYYGVPYENLAVFQKSSPITFVRNAKTPTLILQGELDTTDPMSQSQMLYRGLKWYHVPSEFVVYPREPHGLREQKHAADRYRRSLEWIDKYLKPAI